MYNRVILIGNLTRDVELRYMPSGTAVAKIGVATNRRYKNQLGEQKDEVCYIDVTLFGRTAEVANQYLKKGSKVLIEGRLVLEQWVDQTGQKRSKHSIAADLLQMLDTKSQAQSADEYMGYNQVSQEPFRGATQQPIQNKPANQNNQNIPEIDISEEDIPF